MNSHGFIGVLDSGIGGLSVWREIERLLPEERLIYFADQKHVPYGQRSLQEVCNFAEAMTRFLIHHGVKIVVIASNTTSAAALAHLRNTHPDIPFVGMEPALKPAVERTRKGVIGILATPATFQGDLFVDLVQRYGKRAKVLAQACPGLVEAVERGSLDSPETSALLKKYLGPLLRAGVDQLVLGCTHYPFLLPAMKQLVGEEITLIDPAAAVAAQVSRVLARRKLNAGNESVSHPPFHSSRNHIFFTTGNTRSFSQRLAQLLPDVDRKSIAVRTAIWEGSDRLGTAASCSHSSKCL